MAHSAAPAPAEARLAPGLFPAARFVVHVDADAFFIQVEAARDASLRGVAVALRQHGDVIAANAAAKAAGVTKHMAAADAARALAAVGGKLVHVHTTASARVSYKPYRAASEALMRLLRSLPGAAVVEKASIDEAFLEATVSNEGGSEAALQAACALAVAARSGAAHELGLVLSAGVAPNKLLAKLASAAAKPDGVALIGCEAQAAALLAATPVARLPRAGGALAPRLAAAGIGTAAQLSRHEAPSLAALLSCAPAEATALLAASRGACAAPPVRPAPPQSSMSVCMALSASPRPMHDAAAVSATGGPAGLLTPLRGGERDRVALLCAELAAELAERVVEEAAAASRWPRTFALTFDALPPPPPRGRSRQAAFPPRQRGWPPARADAAADAAAEAAVAAALAAAAAAMLDKACAPDAVLTHVVFLATKFETFATGAHAITALLPPVAASALSPGAPPAGLDSPGGGASPQAALPLKRAADAAPGEPLRRRGGGGEAAQLGARALDVQALLRSLVAQTLQPSDAVAAADAALQRRRADHLREGPPP